MGFAGVFLFLCVVCVCAGNSVGSGVFVGLFAGPAAFSCRGGGCTFVF